ncbi:unnamed protein product [Polarella glacialis]|uniref:Sulfhydryl oxidase n=1 Tax=Polarella glacialis TaxID=89957 RepID=A0A813H8W8_POLGL|nr:unnamed protein product [Polarella glacialis]
MGKTVLNQWLLVIFVNRNSVQTGFNKCCAQPCQVQHQKYERAFWDLKATYNAQCKPIAEAHSGVRTDCEKSWPDSLEQYFARLPCGGARRSEGRPGVLTPSTPSSPSSLRALLEVPEPAQTPVGRSSDPATTTTSDPVVVLLFLLLLLLLLFGVVVGAGLAAAPRKTRARSLSTNTNTNTNSNNHSNNNNDIRLTSL